MPDELYICLLFGTHALHEAWIYAALYRLNGRLNGACAKCSHLALLQSVPGPADKKVQHISMLHHVKATA